MMKSDFDSFYVAPSPDTGGSPSLIKGFIIFILIMLCHASVKAHEPILKMKLSEALAHALERNPAIEAVMAQRQAVESRIWEARSGYWPQLTLSAGATRYQEPNIIIPIHQIGEFPPMDNTIYESAVQLKLPLFNGGRTRAASRAAGAQINESQAQQDLTEIGIIEGITRIYVQAQEMNDRAALSTARLSVLYQRHSELALLLQEGRISPADLALVASSIASARSDSIEITSRKSELAWRMARLLGQNQPVMPVTALAAEAEDNGMSSPAEPPDLGIAADINGPEVRSAQAQLARARAVRDQAASTFWPEISGFGIYNYRSGGEWDPIGEWAAGISLRLPLFEGGRRIANVSAANASLRAAEAQLQAARDGQHTELEIAREQWQAAQVRQQHLALAAENMQRSVAAQRTTYGAGRTSLSDLLAQEAELLRLQSDERGAAYTGQFALLRFHAIAGTLTAELAINLERRIP